jgi:hypothetical protein
MRAVPAAPATQPRPKSGRRRVSDRKRSRFISRASMVGIARPVVLAKAKRSMSVAASGVSSNSFAINSSASAGAASAKMAFGPSQPRSG